MPSKTDKLEETIGRLRDAEVLLAQGASTAEACWQIARSERAYYRWQEEYGGLKIDQARKCSRYYQPRSKQKGLDEAWR